MGVSAVHYIVYGIAVTDEVAKSKFFELDAILDKYHDNSYKFEVTDNEYGVHIIADGMNGEYVVVGKIVSKGSEFSGFELTRLTEELIDKAQILEDIIKLKADSMVDIDLNDIGYIVFTHWH